MGRPRKPETKEEIESRKWIADALLMYDARLDYGGGLVLEFPVLKAEDRGSYFRIEGNFHRWQYKDIEPKAALTLMEGYRVVFHNDRANLSTRCTAELTLKRPNHYYLSRLKSSLEAKKKWRRKPPAPKPKPKTPENKRRGRKRSKTL